MQAEGQVRVSWVILEDAAVCSGATVDAQAGVVIPAHKRLPLRLLAGPFPQTGAARTELSQHKLTDAKVKAQNHDVDHVDQQQAGCIVPGNKSCKCYHWFWTRRQVTSWVYHPNPQGMLTVQHDHQFWQYRIKCIHFISYSQHKTQTVYECVWLGDFKINFTLLKSLD